MMATACGGDDDDGEDEPTDATTDAAEGDDETGDETGEPTEDEQVEIKFAWWGSDARHEQTQQIIAAFEAEHPNIHVEPDFIDWDSYWDRLATITAGGDAPDVMTQEERYMTDYAQRDQLLDLSGLPIDLSSLDPLALGGGQIDGTQYAVATGVNAFTLVADPQMFADAGVEMPDDTAWSWEDLAATAADVSGEGRFGIQLDGSNEAGFKIYARQHGQALYNADGSLGFDAQTLADWWQIQLDMVEAGSSPSATELLEVEGPDTSFIATNEAAMTSAYWTNQLGAIESTAGRPLELLRFPSDGGEPGMYFKPAMFYSISSQTEHPEEAAMFVDFLLNDARSIEIMLTDRGLPANLELREQIKPQLDESNQKVVDFMADLAPDLADPPPAPPKGAGDIPDIMTRLWEELLFDRQTPLEAAEQFITEAETAIGG
jgi:multiple sugar transport system substrate-binding protein